MSGGTDDEWRESISAALRARTGGAGVLASVRTVGAVGFEVLSVFVPEVGP